MSEHQFRKTATRFMATRTLTELQQWKLCYEDLLSKEHVVKSNKDDTWLPWMGKHWKLSLDIINSEIKSRMALHRPAGNKIKHPTQLTIF